MKKIIFLGMIVKVLLCSVSAYSGIYGALGGFGAGAFYSDYSSLNDKLSSAGYPTLNNTQYMIGGGGGFFINSLYLGGMGFGNPGNRIDNGKNVINIRNGFGFFDVGYALIGTENFALTPMIGFGGKTAQIEVSPSTLSNNDFNNIIQNPGTFTRISASSPSIELGMMSLVKMGFTSLVINAGYIYSMQPRWTMEGVDDMSSAVINKPQMSEHSVFVSVGIYFGGYSVGLKKDFMKMGRNFGRFEDSENKDAIDRQIEQKIDTNGNKTSGADTNDLKNQARKVLESLSNQ